MLSVGKSAEAIIFVVRDEFQKYPSLQTHLLSEEAKENGFTGPPGSENDQTVANDGAHHGKHKKGDPIVPDYERCIAIATTAAIKEMVIPGALAVFMPGILGFLLSSQGRAGCLIGSLSSGFMLAVAMSNAGGAWDNAKKYAKALGLNKSEKDHFDATVVGDTVGDPFKDTSGPALNILIKLMSVISLVIAPALKAWQVDADHPAAPVTEWETKSVCVGIGILVALLIAVVVIQRNIDAGYAVKRNEVEASMEAEKTKQKAKADAVSATKAKYPAVFGSLKAIVASADKTGIIETSEVETLLAAIRKEPMRAVEVVGSTPDTTDTMGVDVRTN